MPKKTSESNLDSGKMFAFQAARDLCYPLKVLTKIAMANTPSQIGSIMKQAREDDEHEYISDIDVLMAFKEKNLKVPRKPNKYSNYIY